MLQVWFAELPLEALWLANIYDVLGGSAVWYLGVCSFAADITAAEERASRIARFGGAEQLAFILGNALSPVLFNAGGYELAFRWSTVKVITSVSRYRNVSFLQLQNCSRRLVTRNCVKSIIEEETKWNL